MVDINLSLGVGAGLGTNGPPADAPANFHSAMMHANPDAPIGRISHDANAGTPGPQAPVDGAPGTGKGNGNDFQPPGTQGGARGGLHGGDPGGVHGTAPGAPPGAPQGGVQNGFTPGAQNPAGLQTPPGAQEPANPQAATALSGGDRQAMLNGAQGSAQGSAQGPAAIAMPRDGAPPPTPAELSVSVGGDGTVTVEVSGGGRSVSAPMAPVRFATGDPIAALARHSAPPTAQSGALQLPAALVVTQQAGMPMRLDLPNGGPLRLTSGATNLRQDGGPLFALTDSSAGRGAISEAALAASRDPWALLMTAFAGAGLGGLADALPGQSPALGAPQAQPSSTAPNNAMAQNTAMPPGLSPAPGASAPAISLAVGQTPNQSPGQTATLVAGQNTVQGQANPNGAAANTNSTAFITGGQDALARLLVLGYCPKSALPLLQQTIVSAPRADDPAPALWRNQPLPDSATRALLDDLEKDIPLAVALGYQPMGEALRRRLQAEGPSLLQSILERVARFEGMFGQCPMLPAGKILRRGIADDGPMLRQAAKLALGTVFQELALVAASVFPELGDSVAGFLSRKLSSEIILARGVRGLAIDDGVVALAPETRFVLAGRMRKADDGIHLILLAFGADDRRPILRGAAC